MRPLYHGKWEMGRANGKGIGDHVHPEVVRGAVSPTFLSASFEAFLPRGPRGQETSQLAGSKAGVTDNLGMHRWRLRGGMACDPGRQNKGLSRGVDEVSHCGTGDECDIGDWPGEITRGDDADKNL